MSDDFYSEIARLKQAFTDLAVLASSRSDGQKQLITELCDALEECERFIHTQNRDVAHDPELLRRGRRAASPLRGTRTPSHEGPGFHV